MQLMKQEQENQSPFSFEVPLTRQQLASLTDLCIETTIRTIKKMEREKKSYVLKIEKFYINNLCNQSFLCIEWSIHR